ncbi:DivIVA domain-containing protein [Atopococcus tabaci]|uniref:DivIVA domain-containing protein n=1 Tax=Atopococcus tabaci TaxID=269774 RepID=UPI0024099D80|nr:DivIVA domain-containing protein [Atopococcus tabaci]
MSLTPMDIHNKEFSVRMRGYDQDEVNDYMEQIIKAYELLIKDKKDLEKRLEFAEEKLDHYENMQEALNKSIIVAQEAADRLKENTEKEAEMVIREAENNADQLLKEAVDKAHRIEQETEDLKKHSRIFRQRLQLMIESQLEMIKKEEWNEILQTPSVPESAMGTINTVTEELQTKQETAPAASDVSSEMKEEADVAGSEEESEEGMIPAIELPEVN